MKTENVVLKVVVQSEKNRIVQDIKKPWVIQYIVQENRVVLSIKKSCKPKMDMMLVVTQVKHLFKHPIAS